MSTNPEFASIPDALAYLESLGSPDAIAADFERREIKSRPTCPETCAVDQFLVDACDTEWISVGGTRVFQFTEDWDTCLDTFPVSDVITEFIARFDAGVYPNLISDKYRLRFSA